MRQLSPTLHLASALLAVGLIVTAAGCAGGDSGGSTGSSSSTSGSAGAGGSGAGTGTAGSGGLLLDGGTGGGVGGALPSVLYAHTNTTLFEGDPAVSPLNLAQIGDFDCIGGSGQSSSMTDVAVNGQGELWSISTTRIYRIELQGAQVHCAQTISLNNPQGIKFYGLTFAPSGVLDPNDEVLIGGNSAGELWSIDTGGNLAQRGTFGTVPSGDGNGHSYANAGTAWELSGDIAFFANEGNPIGFATVRDCPSPPSTQGCNNIDTLIELDVPALATSTTGSVTKSVRGQIVRRPSCTDSEPGYGSVYGIAGWQGTVLGFSRRSGNGYAIEISNVDGAACLIAPFQGLPWAGAGITTVAPVEQPPPK